MAREEVMLVGMTLETARLREVAINLNQPNIIKTGSPIILS